MSNLAPAPLVMCNWSRFSGTKRLVYFEYGNALKNIFEGKFGKRFMTFAINGMLQHYLGNVDQFENDFNTFYNLAYGENIPSYMKCVKIQGDDKSGHYSYQNGGECSGIGWLQDLFGAMRYYEGQSTKTTVGISDELYITFKHMLESFQNKNKALYQKLYFNNDTLFCFMMMMAMDNIKIK